MKKAISILMVLVMCFGLCACGSSVDLTEASNKAKEILDKAAKDSKTDIMVSCRMNEESKEFVVRGRLSTYYQGVIDSTKNDSSMPSWLRESVLEELEEQQLREDEKAKEYFLKLINGETAKQIKACFENANVKIVFRYEDVKGRITENEL